MFLGVYRFEGNPDELLAGYERMMASVPADALHLQVCVRDTHGLSVYDACPTREAFQNFSDGEPFRSLLHSVGLPAPTVQFLGDVHSTFFQGKRLA